MASVFKRGSEWRRWDLHIHTPASIGQDYGGNAAWPDFIKALENLPPDVKVVGITDYYFIDGYEKVISEKLKNNKLGNLEKVFPILEFRIDTFASASETKFQKINLHVLFDVDESKLDEELKEIREHFIQQVHLSKHHNTECLSVENLTKYSSTKKLQAGFNELIPDTEEVFKLLESERWRNKTITFLGYLEWNNLEKGSQIKPTKQRLYKKVDAFLSASTEDTLDKKQAILEEFGNRPLLHSLDLHTFKQFEDYKCLTWIKADASFKGLKHAFLNPKERVFLGHTPKRLRDEQDNPERYIDSLTISSITTKGGWFDDCGTIPLNKGLVAIIGDKGNGKSALADIIALGANSSRQNFSFLHKEQFLSAPERKKYSAVVRFADGTSNPFRLDEPMFKPALRERVTYLSQSFVNQLCNQVSGESLQKEVDRVIFAHLPPGKKLQQESLDRLVEHRAGTFETALQELRARLSPINERIALLEEWTEKEYRQKVEHLQGKQEEAVTLHDAAKPAPPVQPASAGASVALVKKYVVKKSKLVATIEEKRKRITTEEYARDALLRGKQELLTLQTKLGEVVTRLTADQVFVASGIDVKALVTVEITTGPIDAVCAQKLALIEKETAYIGKAEGMLTKMDAFIERRRAGQTELDGLHNNYVVKSQEWQQKRAKLIGTEGEQSTLKWYEKELERIATGYPTELAEKYVERAGLAKQIVDTLFEKEDAIKDIYSHVQGKAEKLADKLDVPINEFVQFTAKIAIAGTFDRDFFTFVTRNPTGTFHGVDQATIQLGMLLPQGLGVGKDSLLTVPDAVLRALRHNLQNDPSGTDPTETTRLNDQIAGGKGKTAKDLYDFLFSFKYVDARFAITYAGKPITKLSPGEKGILLLAFYLLIDDDSNPVIIDQPEENIGNLTIAKRLVDFIKLARQSRQIVIVTHSANLAIVCDADQIIHCYMDKVKNNEITYSSGSVELDAMKRHSIDVLEGTKVSFDNRRDVWALLPVEGPK